MVFFFTDQRRICSLLFWKGGHPQKSAPAAGFWNPTYVNPIKFQSALSICFCKYVYCMTSNFLFQNHFAHWWTRYEFKICYEIFFNVPIRILTSEASPIKMGAGGEAPRKFFGFPIRKMLLPGNSLQDLTPDEGFWRAKRAR